MLRISKLADYATAIMLYIAEQKTAKSAAEIAKATGVSLPTTRKIMKLLHNHDLLISIRGAVGGYQLSQSPTMVSLARIIESIDGPLAMTSCCAKDTNCDLSENCAAKPHWQSINHHISITLANVTLASMLAKDKKYA